MNAIFNSIHNTPIYNYIEFSRYTALSSAVYIDHQYFINIFEVLNEPIKKQIAIDNLTASASVVREGIDFNKMALLCLNKDTKNFSSENLQKVSAERYPEKEKPIVWETVNNLVKSFNSELIDHDFIEGASFGGTVRSLEYNTNFKRLRYGLLKAIRDDFNINPLLEMINKLNDIQPLSEVEKSANVLYSNLTILRKQGYIINTVLEFYSAMKEAKTQSNASKEL